MSLIQCCECGEMLSEYAEKCPKCGCPISIIKRKMSENENTEIEKNITSLSTIFLKFKTNPEEYENNIQTLYEDVKHQVDTVKSMVAQENDYFHKINDRIAKILIEQIVDCIDYCSADVCKAYCEIIDFKLLSENTMRFIVNKIYENIIHDVCKCNIIISNKNHKKLWYPINQMILFAPKDIKEPLMEHLNTPNSYNGNRKYIDIQILNAESSGTTVIQNLPKCPTCGSTRIKKIGTLERGASIVGLGIFSKKINKSFKCESCGYMW